MLTTKPLDLVHAMLPIRYQTLARWTHNLAVALGAGVDLRQAVRTSSGEILGVIPGFRTVIEQISRGIPISDALQPVAKQLPPFYIAVVRCGEHTGRLDTTLRFLAEHCHQLDRPQQALRQLWLAPLAVHYGGQWLIFFAQLLLGSWRGLLFAIESLVVTTGTLAALLLLWHLTPLKLLLEQVRLWIPGLSTCERELAVSRFLRVFSLLYHSGDQRVESMWRQSCEAIDNEWLRQSFLRNEKLFGDGKSVTEVMRATPHFLPWECEELEVGEQAGRMSETAERIANRTQDAAVNRLVAISAITNRITMGFVVMSAVPLIMSLLWLSRSR